MVIISGQEISPKMLRDLEPVTRLFRRKKTFQNTAQMFRSRLKDVFATLPALKSCRILMLTFYTPRSSFCGLIVFWRALLQDLELYPGSHYEGFYSASPQLLELL